jgi:DNA-binding transcriptional regulator YiaG
MTCDFKKEQTFLGLSDKQIARLLGVGDRTVRGWKKGRNAVPGSVMRLLLLLREMVPKVRAATIERFMEMK